MEVCCKSGSVRGRGEGEDDGPTAALAERVGRAAKRVRAAMRPLGAEEVEEE